MIPPVFSLETIAKRWKRYRVSRTGRPIAYERSDNGRSLTLCPFGGSITRDGLFCTPSGIKHPDAHVGSLACDDCQFNKATEWEHVLCSHLDV